MALPYLQHSGRPHEGAVPHSGRYPWGSGEDGYQSPGAFYNQVRVLKKSAANPNGMSEKETADFLGMSIQQLRNAYTLDRAALKQSQYRQALTLRDTKGYSDSKIAEIMGLKDGRAVTALLSDVRKERVQATDNVANALRDAVNEKRFIDVSNGVAAYMGVSDTRLKAAVQKLENEGYITRNIKYEQLGTGKETTMKVLAPEGTRLPDIYDDISKIGLPVGVKFNEDGRTWQNIMPPSSVDPKRVTVRYAEDGGVNMDGVIQVRPGVADLSLGKSHYAQVRVLVGKDHYLKGMAMYMDDKTLAETPEGVDIVFNTNKTKDVPMIGTDKDNTVLKPTKNNPDNIFGATISHQIYYDSDGKVYTDNPDGKRKLGAMNIVNEEGKWGEWSKNLSSQFLSKQPVSLAKRQLDKSYDEKKEEYDEIMALTNPDVKRKLLLSFSDDCDSSAVHLKAAAMPRQASHVILPVPDMDERHIYAPQYEDGETVVLVRYPHAGRFEIPTLIVDNKTNKNARKTIGDAIDAVGINPKVAERLSGADFDGDTVLVIPNNDGAVKTKSPLKRLKDFNPSEVYKAYPGMTRVGEGDGFHKQREMGEISNLITDMTIGGADDDEIARAVRHSMVIIDAEKHNLDWKGSYDKEGIRALKAKYQGENERGQVKGASTLISQKKSPRYVNQRKERNVWKDIDPETGEKIYKETGEEYQPRRKKTDKVTGETVWVDKGGVKKRQTEVKALEVEDAFNLSSGTAIETVYANYSNRMKALGNQARKSLLETPTQKYDPSAAKTYAAEVESLKAQLNLALKNAPLERMAQRYANVVVRQKQKDNPDMSYEDLKKTKGQALASARVRCGATKTRIKVTPKEWEAIQAGAINHTTLTKILANTDLDIIKSYATPRIRQEVSASQAAQMKAMLNSGNNTVAEVASKFGVSPATVYNIVGS